MNKRSLIIALGTIVLGQWATGCAFKGRAFVHLDKPVVTEIGSKPGLSKLSVKDEIVALNEDVTLSADFSTQSGFLSFVLVNGSKAPVRILWSESTVMVQGENPLRPIPFSQLRSNSAQAPSLATVTVIPPGGKYVDLVTAIERLATMPIYTTVTKGYRTLGSFQSGTYLSMKGVIDNGVSFDSVVARKAVSEAAPGKFPAFETDEEWAKSVESVLGNRYLGKTVVFMPVVEVDGVKRTLSFSMKVNKVEARIKGDAQVQAKAGS